MFPSDAIEDADALVEQLAMGGRSQDVELAVVLLEAGCTHDQVLAVLKYGGN